MDLLAEFSIPIAVFELGRELDMNGGSDAEIFDIHHDEGDLIGCIKVDDPKDFNDRIQGQNSSVSVIDESCEGLGFVEIKIKSHKEPILHALDEAEADLNQLIRGEDEWMVQIWFRDSDGVYKFKQVCDDLGVPVSTKRIFHPIEVSGDSRVGMTLTQYETLVGAVQAGYYDIPRGTSLVELAGDFGVSDQAVSERLRRAVKKLVYMHLSVKYDGVFGEKNGG